MSEQSQTFGPYSPVRRAGNTYYVSGQVGVNPATKKAEVDVSRQTWQALNNLQNLLTEHGLDMKHVVKTTIFVTDISTFATVNEVYQVFFKAPRPARSTVQVATLPDVAGKVKLLIEIEAVAYKETK